MKRSSIGAVTTAAGLLLPTTAAFAHGGDDQYMHHMGFGMGVGGGFFGFFMMLIVLGMIVGAIVLAFRWLGGGNASSDKRNRALDILEERFAKGEIDKKELDERRRAITD